MKSIIKTFVAACSLMGMMSGCSEKEEIVFDIEKAQFPTRDNAILLEVIPPIGTKADDQIYIVGEFNGGEEAAVGNIQWLCEKATDVDKWGIYLLPSDFVGGKTLADGFYFVRVVDDRSDRERTVKNEDALHKLNVSTGTRTNVMLGQWETYFNPIPVPPPVDHDGYVVYVVNETSWGSELTMYMWGDVNDLNGGWPGMAPTGTQKIDGVTYTYFDMGEANAGLGENLIFNNNGGGSQLGDFAFTIDRDIYLKITDEGVVEIEPNEPPVEHDGYVVYVVNETSWGDDLALYMWGDANDLNGGWPGMAPTGTQKIDGVTYTYFDMGEANTGLGENLIFNNNGNGSQLSDYAFTIDKDIFLKITDKGVSVYDPNAPEGGEDTPSGDEEDEPIVEPDNNNYVVYVLNETGWDDLTLYMWGDKELAGGWPGVQPTGTVEKGGQTYAYFELGAGNASLGENLIFNNNGGGSQLGDFAFTINRDIYLKITTDGVVECDEPIVEPDNNNYVVYVLNETGWDALTMYMWGDINDLNGGWPGMQPTGTVEKDGQTYTYFELGVGNAGLGENLIFNNNGGGVQLDNYYITIDRDYYLKITADGVVDLEAE